MAQKHTSVSVVWERTALTLLAFVASCHGGCSGGKTWTGILQAVGRPCDTTTDAGPAQGVANTAAGICPSQICLKPVVQQGASGTVDTEALCTAECSQDSDCDGESRDQANDLDKRCSRGFVCGIPFAVGPLCCKKLCVCKDFLGPSGLAAPTACTDPDSSAGACGGATSSQPAHAGSVQVQTDVYVSVSPTRLLDLVVMIDNSAGMPPKVSKLNAQFPRLIDALKDPSDGTLPDVRVAIIDSDLGTGCAYDSGSCGPKSAGAPVASGCFGDLGRFQMLGSPSACAFNAGAMFLEYKAGAPVNYTGDINGVFGCLAGNLGGLGCGEEHQLQAFEFALAAQGVGNEEQQRAFLRSNAYLGLVFLTDEDDCSAALNYGMFGDKPELRTESASLRCATRGHMCGGQNLSTSGPMYPTMASYSHPFADCQARSDTCPNVTDGYGQGTDTSVPTDCSPLKSIQRLADEIQGLKSDPTNQILVAGIFGWPIGEPGSQAFEDNWEAATYKIAEVPNPNTADTQHPTVFDYWPVCYDPDHLPAAASADPATGFDPSAAGWGATGGLRESAFIDQFGKNGLKFSICERDFSRAMTTIGSSLAHKLQNLCLDYKLVDTDADPSNGVQADCRVVLRVPTPDPQDPSRVTYQESLPALPQCPPGATASTVSTACWRLAQDKTACPMNGQVLGVVRPTAEMAAKPQLDPGTKLALQCRTCPDAIPGFAAPAGCGYAL
jgi:hypothetical protein